MKNEDFSDVFLMHQRDLTQELLGFHFEHVCENGWLIEIQGEK